MALRQLICVCVCLQLAVALPADGPSPAPQASPVAARADCYKTLTGVPRWCERELIRALFDGSGVGSIGMYCCELLACVREWTCDHVLRGVCPPPEANRYPPEATRVKADITTK